MATIGGDRHSSDRIGMAPERAFGFARREIPEPQRLVRRPGDDVAAIRCDCHGSEPCMAPERAFGFACGQVPNPECVVRRGGNYVAAIGYKRQGIDPVGMAMKCYYRFARG